MSSHSSKTHQASEEEAASPRKSTSARHTLSVTSSGGSLQRTVADPASAGPAEVLALQLSYGNQAVQRLLPGGSVQTKLTVGPAGDHSEQEADRVVDQVMKMLGSQATPRPVSVQRSVGD